MKTYSGIGSRRTPSDVMFDMTYIASNIQNLYTLRSGGADGADAAFEMGVSNGNKEIYLPWKGFNKNPSMLYADPSPDALEVAKRFHPRWTSLSSAAQKLMARNVYQVLGKDLISPVDFVLCWTPDGCECQKTRGKDTGGTGQAISIAEYWGIDVINMKNWNWKDRLNDILTGIELYAA